jgi:hypothetical protein
VDESSVVNTSASGARTTQKGRHRPELLTAPALQIEFFGTHGHFRRVFLALKSRVSI